jgi:hypothetical protein
MPKQAISVGEKSVAINIRLPESLKNKIQELAVRDRRSLAQEIRWLLELAVRIHEKELAQEDK